MGEDKKLGDKNRSLVFKAGETSLNSEHVRTQNFSFEGRGSGNQWRTEGGLWGPPEIPKAIQNRAKLKPIVKTVKNC